MFEVFKRELMEKRGGPFDLLAKPPYRGFKHMGLLGGSGIAIGTGINYGLKERGADQSKLEAGGVAALGGVTGGASGYFAEGKTRPAIAAIMKLEARLKNAKGDQAAMLKKLILQGKKRYVAEALGAMKKPSGIGSAAMGAYLTKKLLLDEK